jgi:hypothetical protein
MGHNISIALFEYLHDALIFTDTIFCCHYVVCIRTLITVGKVCGVNGLIKELLVCNSAQVKSLLYYVAFLSIM